MTPACDYRAFVASGEQDCGSPSQQPSLNAQRGHCQVWWRQSMAPPHRGQCSRAGSAFMPETLGVPADGQLDLAGACSPGVCSRLSTS